MGVECVFNCNEYVAKSRKEQEHLDSMVAEFPEMYHSDGSIFRALRELKRLITMDDFDKNELAMALRDIDDDLRGHLRYSPLERGKMEIVYDLGSFTEDEAKKLFNGTAELQYQYVDYDNLFA